MVVTDYQTCRYRNVAPFPQPGPRAVTVAVRATAAGVKPWRSSNTTNKYSQPVIAYNDMKPSNRAQIQVTSLWAGLWAWLWLSTLLYGETLAEDFQRTVVLLHASTVPGENIFFRGG